MAHQLYNRKWNPFDETVFEKFLETLAETGMFVKAADSVGCNVIDARNYRRNHPEFEELCQAALEYYRCRFLEAAEERAVKGYTIPIIGGRNRDEIVAEETRFSDRLLELFLKRGTNEHFTDKQEIVHTGQVVIREHLDLRSLSKRVRMKLRELLALIEEDNARIALGHEIPDPED